jgi:uncharacterized protein (TIGR03083 family)
MGSARQFYQGSGAPLRIDQDPGAPAAAWRSHRARLGAWLDGVPDPEWSGATLCTEWDVTALVRHLASGSQFLGYTLHCASAGQATTLLAEFDSHRTVQASAAMLGELTPAEARSLRAEMDASVSREIDQCASVGWQATAEAPPGWLLAPLVVNHFLFDSWVHEYDLMVPRGEQPPVDPDEATPVLQYVVGLASLQAGAPTPFEVRITDLDLRVAVGVEDGVTVVSRADSTAGTPVVEGPLVDVIYRATGRRSGAVDGDGPALAVLDTLAELMSG